jgi:hypothetical protein
MTNKSEFGDSRDMHQNIQTAFTYTDQEKTGYWVSSNPTDIQTTYLPNSKLERYA